MLLHPDRAQSLAHTVEADARVFAKFLLPGSDPRSALKGEPQVAHRVAWATMSLATVKRAGHTFDATVNDVVVAAVAGAVGRHLRDRGDEVDEVHALVPFNLRSLDQPLPRDLGNRFGLVLLGLPVGVEDPIERLRAVQGRMSAIKSWHEGAISYGILGVIGRTPPLVEERLVNFFAPRQRSQRGRPARQARALRPAAPSWPEHAALSATRRGRARSHRAPRPPSGPTPRWPPNRVRHSARGMWSSASRARRSCPGRWARGPRT